MQGHTESYKTTNVIENQEGDNQLTKQDCTRLYKTQDHQESSDFIPCMTLWTIHNQRRPYKMLQKHTEPKRTIQ